MQRDSTLLARHTQNTGLLQEVLSPPRPEGRAFPSQQSRTPQDEFRRLAHPINSSLTVVVASWAGVVLVGGDGIRVAGVALLHLGNPKLLGHQAPEPGQATLLLL